MSQSDKQTSALSSLADALPAPYNAGEHREAVLTIAMGVFIVASNIAMKLALKSKNLVGTVGGQAKVRDITKLISTALRLCADHVDSGTDIFLAENPQEEKGAKADAFN